MSRWERWTTKPKQGMSLSGFIAEQQSPAEMAKSMGLQSDGSGGYIDPETGEVVARTVNNELVFYDPMGGAISAQSDGAELTQAQPSWRDPVTGEITVPPGQAESPEEISAIPDVVPALAPASYNAFMNKKKKEMYANQEPPQQEEEEPQEEEPEMQPEMGMQGEGLTYSKLMEMPRDDLQDGTQDGDENKGRPRLDLSKVSNQKESPQGINWEKVRGAVKGESKGAQKVRGLIGNDRVREHFQKMMDAKQTRQSSIDSATRNASNIEEAMVMFESQGYTIGSNGKLTFKPSTDLHSTLADNSKPAGVANSRQFGGWDYDQKDAILGNEKLMTALKNNDIGALQRMALRNKFTIEEDGITRDNSWEIAKEIFENRMERGLQTKLNNFGTPLPPPDDISDDPEINARTAFNPMTPVRYHLDDEGNYTGGNNIDDLWQSGDPEQYEQYLSHFGVSATDKRGIANLQKLLLSGGLDILTGRDENITPGNGTIDHLFGRSNKNPEAYAKMKKESPMNMGVTMGNTNQFKVRTGDDPSDMGSFDFDGVNNIEEWIASRLDSDVWQRIIDQEDKAQLASAADPEGGGTGGIPDNIEDFLKFKGEDIKQYISDYSQARPHGLDIRNLGKLAPEPRIKKGEERSEIGWLDNTWSGGRGWSEYDKINPMRASLAGAILKSTEFNEVEQEYFESQGITVNDDGSLSKNGKKLSVSATQKEYTNARTAKRGWIGDKYTNNIRGLSTIYGLGKMSNDEYVDHHKNISGRVLDLIDNPDLKEKFKGVADENLDQWRGKLNEWFDTTREGQSGSFPIPRTKNALEQGAMSKTPTAIRALMRSPLAKKYLDSKELEMLTNKGF
jgi:hypothetical protein